MIQSPRPRFSLALAGPLAALLLAGCGSATRTGVARSSDSTVTVPAPVSAATAAEPRLIPVDAAGVLAAARAPGSTVTVVNLWATWCMPCREEFPELVRFARQYGSSGVRVLYVSTDFEDQLPAVRKFLAAQGVDQPSYIKTGDDMAFIDGIHPEWSGSLPATFVFDSTGRLRTFWEGAADFAKFETEVKKVLPPS